MNQHRWILLGITLGLILFAYVGSRISAKRTNNRWDLIDQLLAKWFPPPHQTNKRVMVCDTNQHELGRLTTWLHESYAHTMATDLERARYQFNTGKFDLVVADLPGIYARLWLAKIEASGQRVLYLGRTPIKDKRYLTKPRSTTKEAFEEFRKPFQRKVAKMLREA